jgi:hypothetical protein
LPEVEVLMPLFFISGIFALGRLARRVGVGVGIVAAHLWQGSQHLNQKRLESSPHEKSAWLRRCLIATALVIAEYFVLSFLSPRLDTVPSLLGSWLVVMFLPKPTPRIPLLIARSFALATTSTSFGSVWIWAVARWPVLSAADSVYLVFWWSLAFALLVWSFLALRRPHNRALALATIQPAQQQARGDSHSTPYPAPATAHATSVRSNTHASFEWTTKTTRIKLSAEVRTEKVDLTVRSNVGQ